MCVPVLGAAIGAIGSVMSGIAGMQAANYQAEVAKINAELAMREGLAQAGATRDQYEEVKGAQRAALAKSGVDVTAGTSAILAIETQRREEAAAAVDIWRGRVEETKYLNQAKAAKAEGRAAMIGGIIGGISGLVGGMQGSGQGSPLKLGQASPQVTGVSSGSAGVIRSTAGRIPISPLRLNRGMV